MLRGRGMLTGSLVLRRCQPSAADDSTGTWPDVSPWNTERHCCVLAFPFPGPNAILVASQRGPHRESMNQGMRWGGCGAWRSGQVPWNVVGFLGHDHRLPPDVAFSALFCSGPLLPSDSLWGHPCSCVGSAAPSCLGRWAPAGPGCSGCVSSQAVAGQRRVGPVFTSRSSPLRLAGLRAGAGFGHRDLCLQRLKRTTLCPLDEQPGKRRSEVWEAGVGELSPNASPGLLKRWCSPTRGWWFGFLSTLGP